jgi:hypothetical protein
VGRHVVVVRAFPAQSKAIAGAGQRIGDHSVSHPYFTKLTDAQIRDQVLGAESQITSVTGRPRPVAVVALPVRDYNEHAISVVNGTGLGREGPEVQLLRFGASGPSGFQPECELGARPDGLAGVGQQSGRHGPAADDGKAPVVQGDQLGQRLGAQPPAVAGDEVHPEPGADPRGHPLARPAGHR